MYLMITECEGIRFFRTLSDEVIESSQYGEVDIIKIEGAPPLIYKHGEWVEIEESNSYSWPMRENYRENT